MNLDINGSYYTWNNGHKYGIYSYVKLDRSICNQNWLDNYNTVTCSTLIKHHSNH